MVLVFPKLIAFDLDYTLWPFWVDCHISGGPFKINEKGQVSDRSGFIVKLYKDVASILEFLRIYKPDVKLAIASRTPEPEWAREIIDLLQVQPDNEIIEKLRAKLNLEPIPQAHINKFHNKLTPFIQYFVNEQLYPGNKLPHFKAIHKATSVHFEDMIFFDDEPRNVKDVSTLGVVSYLVDSKGLNLNSFLKALEQFSNFKTSR